ncbi:MAG: two-component regulator propeller domain-containing protein [Paludibacter sp.]|nr:two-component regulator propeller domain-containing protein [Paludibacter sp.]
MKSPQILLKSYCWIYFIVILLTTSVSAENQPIIELINSNNGLSHNTIRCMMQDKTGFLWFGSLNGLNRYDGIKIKSLKPERLNPASISSGKIKELHQDSFGHIWVRSYNDDMECYDPHTEKFLSLYENKTNKSIKYKLFYEDRQKNIWLGSATAGCVKICFDKENVSSTIFNTATDPTILPSNTVFDIFQDSKLNTWILTSKGVALYKNNAVVNLKGVIKDHSEFIKAYELNKKVYLISLKGLILIYNPANNKFETSNPGIASNVLETSKLGTDKILISTTGNGIYVYNTSLDQFTTADKLYGEHITGRASFQSDQFGNVWTYNFSGNLWKLSPAGVKPVKINIIPTSLLPLIDQERYQFLGDKYRNVWIATYGNGLFCYNTVSGNLDHYKSGKNIKGLASNYLLSMVLDKNENIWVGTENMGVNKLSFANRNVQLLYPDAGKTVINDNVIRAFLEDRTHNIWVSTKAGNLYKYDPTLTHKSTIFENGYNVYNMYQDKSGSIWLATKGNGIVELKNGVLSGAVSYKNTPNQGSLSINTVFSLTKDRKDRLWAATFGGGVCVKLTRDGIDGFRTYFSNDDWVRFAHYIFMDKNGDLWVGTTNGVLRFNPDKLLSNPKAYKHYTFNVASENCLSNPEVRYIFQDSKRNVWVATAGGGLNKFLGEGSDGNGIFKVYSNKQGMANDNIMAIQEDKAGCLWISTEGGLHKFNPQTNLFQLFKFSDDFSSNIFSEATCLTRQDGRMLWGSLNGFYSFNPKQLDQKQKEKSKVLLTGFFIYDQEAKIDSKNSPLKQSVTFTDKITLKASDKVFHIDFSSLNFSDPGVNQFMYMLENYEKRWNLSGTINAATYRNVLPGHYTFLVKGMNSQGVWDNEPTRLEIIISPPFWLSPFAYFIYLLLILGIAYFTFKLIIKFNNLNNAVTVERQLTDYKLRFFTNISHEFRTPLTLIKGSVDTLNELKSKMTEPLHHVVNDLEKNTTHMLRLIDQLMEFRKFQNNKQKLYLQLTDAVPFLDEIFKSFNNVAERSNIHYEYLHKLPEIPIYLDQNKVDKIVFNLLSNAFKFTPRGGKIFLVAEVVEAEQLLKIKVVDNGIGIPKEKQNMLFGRFMQINFSAHGTGVGLSLVNEFTTLHKGTVHFNENEGGGSVFSVKFTINKEVYNPDDFVEEQIVVSKNDKQVYNLTEFFDHKTEDSLLNFVPLEKNAGVKYKILVIDDNDDIRDFLCEKLNPHFEVITAEDGEIGFAKSMEEDPDLIICDVMMPGMNGFELTKKLKDDFATCHIPIILLTAYISDEHNTEGIKAGADAYISKPFSMTHLMLQVNKLIEKREKINKHYANADITIVEELELEMEEIELAIPERDSQFLKLIEQILEKHLTNPEFSVDEFAQMTYTGRTLFFKKIKFLTGYSPNEFIRFRRMKKAAELLKSYKYNVSEVSYMVGINDPFYFSKCFKAQYGCSPSHYINS